MRPWNDLSLEELRRSAERYGKLAAVAFNHGKERMATHAAAEAAHWALLYIKRTSLARPPEPTTPIPARRKATPVSVADGSSRARSEG